MGRGLSEQQKRILSIMYEIRRGRDFEAERQEWEKNAQIRTFMISRSFEPGPDATYARLIAELFDWPDMWGTRFSEYDEDNRRSYTHGRHFARHPSYRYRVDKTEYNRKTTSFYKSLYRLIRRGLVERRGYWPKLYITEQGIAEAEKLLASKGAA